VAAQFENGASGHVELPPADLDRLGKELIYFHNDPYKSIIGGKHPWALGRPTRESVERDLARYQPDAGYCVEW
jgi:hypothetical protein